MDNFIIVNLPPVSVCKLQAISRRATLHEMIRDYSQAANDLQRLISLLGRKEDRLGGGRSTNNKDDPELARLRLAKVEEKARKEIPLDMYKILYVSHKKTLVWLFPSQAIFISSFFCRLRIYALLML